MNKTSGQISLKCSFAALTSSGVEYRVVWYKNETEIHSDNLGTVTVSLLEEETLGVVSLGSSVRRNSHQTVSSVLV